jgi:homoserine dehydrogenase
LGYAEADPTFDVEGIDTAHKLALLLTLCFGTRVNFADIYTEGITSISAIDINFASQFGYRIKLLAIGKRDGERLEARVHPTMIPVHYPMADVDGAFNAIRLAGDFVGPVMLYGRGAGMEPTASAVAGDLIDISRNILAGIGKRVSARGFMDGAVVTLPIKHIGEIVSRYYLRFSAVDQPGVLAAIAGALGRNGISIESMIQTGRSGDHVPIVIITHEAKEHDITAALAEIDGFAMIKGKSCFIRIEDNLE